MPAIELFKNNITTTLAIGINSAATTINVASGTGASFPTLTGGNYFRAVLTSSAVPGSSYEYIIVTAVSGDNLTVIRGQEGSTAASWNAGDIIYMTATAASLGTFAQGVDLSAYAPLNSPNFTGIPLAPTPPQFDDDTFIATTEFVAKNCARDTSVESISGATTLTSSAFGKVYNCNGSSYTINLPLANTLPIGSHLTFISLASGTVTIHCQGSDMFVQTGGGQVSSIQLKLGDTLILDSSTANYWHVISGSLALTTSTGQFGAYVSSIGYQKLPSGLILQWGYGNTNPSGISDVVFPIAFPNAPFNVFSLANSSSVSAFVMTFDGYGLSATGARFSCSNGNNTPISGADVRWLAIGY